VKAKLVHLTERQFQYLEKSAKKLGISSSELLRRILDERMDRFEASLAAAREGKKVRTE